VEERKIGDSIISHSDMTQVPTSFRNFITSHIYRVIITGKILGAEGNITKEANTYVEGSAQTNSCSDHTIHLVQGGIR